MPNAVLRKIASPIAGFLASILSALIVAWLSGQKLPRLEEGVALLSTQIPIWLLAVPGVSILSILWISSALRQSAHSDRERFKDAFGFFEDFHAKMWKPSREILESLSAELLEKRTQLQATQENYDAIAERHKALRAFCSAGEQYFRFSLLNFYPLILAASERLQIAYTKCTRGKRDQVHREFAEAFAAGRNCGPMPGPDRQQFVFYAGLIGQLVLDIAFQAELSTKLPLAMQTEHDRSPAQAPEILFERCLDALQAKLLDELPQMWSETPDWAFDVLDGLIEQAEAEVSSQEAAQDMDGFDPKPGTP